MRSRAVSSLAGVAAFLSGCGPATDVRPPASPALPFIVDDYETAVEQARERELPLFVESWAPW